MNKSFQKLLQSFAGVALLSVASFSMAATYDYDFDADPDNFGLTVLFTDNGYSAAASTLAIASGASPVSYAVDLTIISPSGRRMVRARNFFQKLKTP